MADNAAPADVFDYARAAATQLGIDPDVAHRLIDTESGGDPNAVGPPTRTGDRAFGPAQLMPSTAAELSAKYGGDPSNWQDNVILGLTKFRDDLQHFNGDYTKAAAAYQAGRSAVDRAGGPTDTSDGITSNQDYAAKVAGIAPSADLQKEPSATDAWLSKFQEQPKPGLMDIAKAGFKNAIAQTPQDLEGVVGLAGATGEKIFGEGGISTELKNWGLKKYQEFETKQTPVENADLDTAWGKAKQGDVGALVDWATYGLSNFAGQVAQAGAASLVGAVVGSAAGPEGTAAGAVAGAVDAGAIRALARGAIEGLVSKQAAKMAVENLGADASAKALTDYAASDAVRTAATKAVTRGIGSAAGAGAFNASQIIGSDYAEAQAKADQEGRQLTGGDLAKQWALGTLAAVPETILQKMGLGWLTGDGTAQTGSRLANAALTAGKGAVAGAAGMGTMTELSRAARGEDLTSPDAMKELRNSAALGTLGGGVMGAAGGVMKAPVDTSAPAAPRGHVDAAGALGLAQRYSATEQADKTTKGVQSILSAGNADDAIKAFQELSAQHGGLENLPTVAEAQVAARKTSAEAAVPSTATEAEPGTVPSTPEPVQGAAMAAKPTGAPATTSSAVPPHVQAVRDKLEGNTFQMPSRLSPPEPTAPPPQRIVDFTPMSPMQASQRLAVLRGEARQRGEDPNAIVPVDHPRADGKYAIATQDTRTHQYSPELQGQSTRPAVPMDAAEQRRRAFVHLLSEGQTPADRQLYQDHQAGRVTDDDLDKILTPRPGETVQARLDRARVEGAEQAAAQPRGLEVPQAANERLAQAAAEHTPGIQVERASNVKENVQPKAPFTEPEQPPAPEQPQPLANRKEVAEKSHTSAAAVEEANQRLAAASRGESLGSHVDEKDLDFTQEPARNVGEHIFDMAKGGADAHDILQHIAENSTNPQNRALAHVLTAAQIHPDVVAGEGRPATKELDGKHGVYGAEYNPKDDRVTLHDRSANTEKHFLHEAVHSATVQALRSEQSPASRAIRDLYQHVKSQALAKIEDHYGLKNPEEFVAEAFTNHEFQQFLQRIPAKRDLAPAKSIWDAFVHVVRDILGIRPGQESALSQVISHGTKLMEENTKERDYADRLKYGDPLGDKAAKQEIPGYKRLTQHLTPEEEDKLRTDTAQRTVGLFKSMGGGMKEMAEVANAGRAKKGWYRGSAEALVAVFHEDAPRFAALLAALSPQTSVEANLVNALNSWRNWERAGRPTSPEAITKVLGDSVFGNKGEKSVLDAWRNNAIRALATNDFSEFRFPSGEVNLLSGPKVNSFFNNLIGVTHAVTNDTWQANYLGVKQAIFGGSKTASDSGKGPGYLAASALTRAAAKQLKWTPSEVQETVWSWTKALYELSTRTGKSAVDLLKEGALTHEEIRGTPDFRTLLTEPKYRSILDSVDYADRLDRMGQGAGSANADNEGARLSGPATNPRDLKSSAGRLLLNAARRLDDLRAQRDAESLGSLHEGVEDESRTGERPEDAAETRARDTRAGAGVEGLGKPANGSGALGDQGHVGTREQVGDRIAAWKTENAVLQAIRNKLADTVLPSPGFGFLRRTFGTQFGKSQADPAYKPVFERSQQFVNDTTRFAQKAEALAPNVFPRRIRDAAPSRADNEKVGEMLTRGTLYGGADPHAGHVWTDDEMRDQFGATDRQMQLYRQARAADNEGLSFLAKAEMAKHLMNAGIDEDAVRQLVHSNLSLAEARDEMEKLAATHPDPDLAKAIHGVAGTALDLMAHGYHPLQRFGDFAVTARDENAEVVMHHMTDSHSEARQLAKEIASQNPNWDVTAGRMSKEDHQLYNGLTPEAVELFARETGLDKDAATQAFLKRAIASRSALKRMIERKGIPGFSKDAVRTTASFITSNARRASALMNAAHMLNEAAQAPDNIRDEAIKLVKYVLNPSDASSKFRGFLFFNYLGGSVAAGVVNLTQPFMMTYPELSRYGAGRAAVAMKEGFSSAKMFLGGKKVGDPVLQAALERAQAEGITDPQEIHQMMGAAQRGAKSIWTNKFSRVWGMNFGLTEAWNRTWTFASAFKVASKMSEAQLAEAGVKDPYEFATNAVRSTQGLYNTANRPNISRNAVGATVMTFKQFTISYIEMLQRLWGNSLVPRKEAGIALGMMIMASGINGLPGADDLDDVIDTFGAWMGYATNSKRAKREFLSKVMGPQLADMALEGASSVSPIDVQQRIGMSNIVPGTGLFNPNKSADERSREIFDMLGPAGGLAQNVLQGVPAAAHGDIEQLAKVGLPVAVRNAMWGGQMAQTGEYRDTKGRLVTKTTPADAAVKAIGFQPSDVAAPQRQMSEVQGDIDIVKTKQTDLNQRYAQALFDHDQVGMEQVRQDMTDWNQNNPDMKVRMSPGSIANQMRQMLQTKNARFIKSAPKQMRGQVASELATAPGAGN